MTGDIKLNYVARKSKHISDKLRQSARKLNFGRGPKRNRTEFIEKVRVQLGRICEEDEDFSF